MPDLREHFFDLDRQLAQLDMPDLLADAVRRDPRPEPDQGPSLPRRVGIVLVALAVTAAATSLVVRTFRDESAQPQPAAPPSPNGVIAYASIAPQRGFWTVQPDGTGRTEVHIKVPGSVGIPSWSPDGRRIVFSVQSFEGIHSEQGNWDIYTANADGSDPVRLTSEKAEFAPVWSPDGTSIAYVHRTLSNNEQIWVMNADGSDPRELRGGMFPSWSPDGTKIAFASFVGTNADIYVMNADGSNVTRLTNDPGHDDEPVWSPDGRRIAFTREGSGDAGIYTMSPDGSGIAELIHDPSPANLAMAWSPDGTEMAIVSMRGPGMDRNVYVLDVATGALTAIGDPGAWWGASWQPLPTSGASPTGKEQS